MSGPRPAPPNAAAPARPAEAEEVARAVVARELAEPRRVEPLIGGLSNQAFDVETDGEHVVVRLGDQPDKLAGFERERRAVERARAVGVPTPEIVSLGQEGKWAYVISRRLPGAPAVDHRERLCVLKELGRMARLIHTIRTTGYGSGFGWVGDASDAAPPRGAATWPDFLHDELGAVRRLARLRELGMISDRQQEALETTLAEVSTWNDSPVLNHGDLRLKNVVVDEEGRILGLVDWELSISSIGPHWDLSVALHDLSIDAKQALLEGYDMPEAEVRQAAPVWRLFNLLNYVPKIEELLEARDAEELEQIRTRLSGALDLFGAHEEW